MLRHSLMAMIDILIKTSMIILRFWKHLEVETAATGKAAYLRPYVSISHTTALLAQIGNFENFKNCTKRNVSNVVESLDQISHRASTSNLASY